MAGTSRVNREVYARFCGRLEVQFLRPTRQEGDVIVAWDENPVPSIDALHRLLTEQYLGASAQVTLLRRTQKLERTIRPTELQTR
jgi:S1-C subfamily serine protease